MASLKLSLFEEHHSGDSQKVQAKAVETRIMPVENCRCQVAQLIRASLGKNAKILLNKGRLEISSRRPLRKVGAVSIWGRATVIMQEGSAYELNVLAALLAETLSASD